jgi:hypothetical protein
VNRHRRAFITAAILVASSGVVAGTNASYNALTENDAATFTIDLVKAPVGGSLTGAVASGGTMSFTAYNPTTPPKYQSTNTNAPYAVLGSAGDSSATTCPAASPANFPTLVATGPAGDPVTLTGVGSPYAVGNSAIAGPGSYVCFMVTGTPTAGSEIYSLTGGVRTSARARVGHFISTAVWNNGAGNNNVAASDNLKLTFSQAVDTSAGPTNTTGNPPTAGDNICVNGDLDVVVFGSHNYTTGASPCTATEVANATVGVLYGMNLAAGVQRSFGATYAWNSPTNTILTITLGTQTTAGSGSLGASRVANIFDLADQTWWPSATGGVDLCREDNSTSAPVTLCQPTWTTSRI